MQGNGEKATRRGNLNSRILGPKPRERKGWANPRKGFRKAEGTDDLEKNGSGNAWRQRSECKKE